MNVLLWVLQILLALHTAIGAVWKFSNPTETVPSLSAIPQNVWLSLSVFELLCSLVLILSAFLKPLRRWVPLAAAGIATEMVAFCALHLAAGDETRGPVIYWLVVAALCAFVAYGRLRLRRL